MQSQNRLYDNDIRKYLYPQCNEYEREKENGRSQIARNLFNRNKKQNLELHYNYDDQQISPSSFIMNKELSRNALGYPRDENQFSVLDNNSSPFSYMNRKCKPEGKIYHYSIAARKDYSRDKEEEYNTYYYPEQRSRKYYIDKRNTYNENNNYLYGRQTDNILPTKVYISDSYPVKKNDSYKFRPSREKDGYKGGIVNLRRRKYSNASESYDNNSIILIQRWWRNLLNKKRNGYLYYQNIASRKTYTKENERITEKIIPGENDKFIVQTTRVEVFKRPYMNIPLLKPEIITKEIKQNFNKKNYAGNEYEIVLDKETLKEHMRNIWNEENMSTSAESLSIVQNESAYSKISTNEMKRISINSYEEQIKQLRIALSKKERELIEYSNKLRELSKKRIISYQENENYLKKDEIEVFGIQKRLNEDLKIQLVDKIFIRNNQKITNYRNRLFNRTENVENVIENMYNIEIIPIEKEPLKKQLIDSLCIQGEEIFNITLDGNDDESKNIFRNKKQMINKFGQEKLLLEANDNIEILPIEKEPLKKQLVDNLFIERLFSLKPENKIQKIDKLTILKTPKPQNMIEEGDNLELLPIKKQPLKKQLIDALFIEGLILLKPENEIQNIEKISIFKSVKPKNMIEVKDSLEIIPIEKQKEPLRKQLVDNLFIEKLFSTKPENKIQNLDKLSIFRIPKPDNIIEGGDNLEILPKEKEPLQRQIIDALIIEGLTQMKPKNIIQETEKLSIFKMPRDKNMIELRDNIEISPIEREPLQKQLVDDLYIEKLVNIKPQNEIQNTEILSIFKTPKPDNIIEAKDNIEISPMEKEPLKKQLVDDLYIEPFKLNKPENKIQNIDKLSIFETPKPDNIIEIKENLEILPIEKEPLKEQIIDAICIDSLEKCDNEIQNISLMTILRTPKIPNVIEPLENIFISPKEKDPLKYQIVDELLIDGKNKIENEIQNIDGMEILRTQKKQIYLVEEKENIQIMPLEKQPLNKQLVDELLIEGNMKPDIRIQTVDKMEILKTPKCENKIEEKESIFIAPKVKEPFKNQIIDSLLIEGNLKPKNEIQIVDKMDILKTPKPDNMIDNNFNISILPKEKEPLMKQLVDDLTIERKNIPNNEIQNIDKIEILESIIKPKNIIEEKECFYIAPKERELLKNQNVDNIIIDGITRDDYNIQLVDEINILRTKKPENIIELNETLFIAPVKKEPLKCQLIDNIVVEGNAAPDNEIQNVGKLDILRTPKPDNIIQENDNIFIGPKEKESLKRQLIDNIQVLGIERDDNFIQIVDKIEILSSSKIMPKNKIEEKESLFIKPKEKQPLNMQLIDVLLIEGIENLKTNNEIQQVNKLDIPRTPKPENIIEEKEAIFIKSKGKDPLKIQSINDIYIYGNKKSINEIQVVNKMDIPRTPKPENVIEEKETIFIKPKEKEPLKNQVIDSMIVSGDIRPNNEIQIVNKMDILRTPKPKNSVIEVDKIKIDPEVKEPLKKQLCDELKIEGNINGYGNEIQKVDEIDIGEDMKLRGKKRGNIIITNDSLFIPSKNKEPLKLQIVDNISVEGNLKPNNEIQNVDKMDILRTPRPENQMEQKENIFISPKEKEPLKKQFIDDLLIESTKRVTNSSIQEIDKFEIIKEPKAQNIIEKKEILYIPSKKKDPVIMQKVDVLLIEEEARPENISQTVQKLDILKSKKPKIENIIEQKENIFITPKEKEPLAKQLCDELIIEGNIKNVNEIQVIVDKMEILRTPKPKNIIQLNEQISILPQKKEPLQSQTLDRLLIDGCMNKQDNLIQNIDKIKISEVLRPKNIISANEELIIQSQKKEPLKKQLIDNIIVEGNMKPDNEIQIVNQLEVLKSKKPINIVLQDNGDLFIPSKIKEPLKDNKVDNIIIEGNAHPENKIQNVDEIEIIKTVFEKPENIIEEKESLYIKPKEKEPLKNQVIDSIIVGGDNRPNNEIQIVNKMNILRTPKPKNSVIEVDKIKIDPEVKEPLKLQLCDELIVEGENRPENAIQQVDEIEIENTKIEGKNEDIIIECNDNIFIPPKEREPYKYKEVDSILIEGIYKPKNEIETAGMLDILKSYKPIKTNNIIEQINNIFIAPNEKQPLELQTIDQLSIDETEKPNNEKQIANRFVILKSPKIEKKEENQIEKNCILFVEPKEKIPLEYQLLDSIIIEGVKPSNNIIKNVDAIKIIPERNIGDNIMEQNVNLVISPIEKEPLEKQIVDKIIIEGNKKEDNNEIQYIDELNMEEIPRPDNIIENINDVFISRKEREPLICKSVDKLYIESLIPQIPKKKYIIDNRLDKFTINPLKEYMKKKEPLTINKLEEINFQGLKIMEEKEDDKDNADTDKAKLRTKHSPKNVIQKNEDINIISKEKKLSKPKNIIQNNEQFKILKSTQSPKISEKLPSQKQNIIIKNDDIEILSIPKKDTLKKDDTEIISKPKEGRKEILCKDKMDELKIEGLIRPKDEIETIETFDICRESIPKSETKEKKEIPLSENKTEDLYIKGIEKPKDKKEKIEKIKEYENQIEKTNEYTIYNNIQNIPKTAKKPNEILHLDKIYLPSIEKEPLEKQKVDDIKIDDMDINMGAIPEEEKEKIKKGKKEKEPPESIIKSPKKKELMNDQMDELIIESEKRPDNAIESVKKMKIPRMVKPENEIIHLEKIEICPEKKEIQKELKVRGFTEPNQIQKVEPINIMGINKPMPITEIKKEPLIKNNNEEIFIKGVKVLSSPKKIQNLQEENANNVCIEGKKKIIPLNEKKNIDKIMISSIEKKPLMKEMNKELFIEGQKIPKKEIIEEQKIIGEIKPKTQNEIMNIDKIMISSLEKEPLLKHNNEEVLIKGTKVLSLAKAIPNLQEIKNEDININGIQKVQKPNMIKNQEPIFIPSTYEKPIIEEIKQEIKQKKPVNEIKNIDKILLSSLDKPLLSEEKAENIYLEGKQGKQEKQEKPIKTKEEPNEIDYIDHIYISPRKKEPFKKQFINEVYIENKKPDNIIKEKTKIFENINKEEKDKLFIEGKKKDDEEDKKQKKQEIKKYEICPQTESLTIESNVDPEITEELYILRTKYKKIKKEIKPILENSFFIKGSPKPISISTSEIKPQNIPIYQIYQKNDQYQILGKERKPNLIENKGCFNIISSGKKFNNILIAQGSCFGLLGKPNEPGQKTQGIEITTNNNWNNANRAQRIYNINIKGNNNAITWNDFIVSQKGIFFRINGINKSLDLKRMNEGQINIINKKEDEEKIVKGDYNYSSLERDEKQRRTVKATITKIYREVQNDDDDLDELDPFSSCKRHTGKKYDKIFQERKTTSVRIGENREIGPHTILSKEDDKKKPGTLIINKTDKDKLVDSLLAKNTNERKSGPVIVFKDIKNIKEKKQDINKFKNVGNSRSQVMFKKKEKKTEYLRDYDNDQQFYN